MKNILTALLISIVTLTSFGQNNAPIAINDTFYLSINESLSIQQYSNTNNSGFPESFLLNDSDPDGNRIYADTAFYSGTGIFSTSFSIISVPDIHILDIDYTPALNYWGIDSIHYILHDNGNPVMFDTATIYMFVKRPESAILDLNNMSATFGLSTLFYKDNHTGGLEVPKGSDMSTVFGANLWLSGKNQNTAFSNTEIFGSEYPVTILYQTFHGNSGPIMNPLEYKRYDYKWDRHWKITSTEIDYHINNWNMGGYQPIEVIENWPAHGDVSKGQAANLAPFIDNNNDGIYNPMDGDYPQIKGQQAVYHIYNDMRYQPRTPNPMSTEVHYMAYAYNCPSDSAINNTIFLDYTVHNRSNLTYDSTYIGMWTDFDIGHAHDDYVGCDIKRGAYYGYNGDNNDENTGGIIGYGSYPPAQGVAFLKGAKQDNDGIDNPFTSIIQDVIDSSGTPYAGLGLGFGDDITDNEFWGMEHFIYFNNSTGSQGDPSNDIEYHNYLSGKWKDGSPMVFGETGHNSSGGTIPSKYLFPGVTDPLNYGTGGLTPNPWLWTEVTELNPASDRRGVGSTGPFTFEPGSSISITLAYVFGRDYQNAIPASAVFVMQERIDSIRSYYLNDFKSVCGGNLTSLEKIEPKEKELLIYPNPFNTQFTINYELVSNIALLEVYNGLGKKIQTKTITQNTTVIDLSNQTNGFYFVTITDGTNRISKKIIKQ